MKRIMEVILAGLASASVGLILPTPVFAGDLVALRYAGSGLFPLAAPTGGFAMMFGWLAIAVGAFIRRG